MVAPPVGVMAPVPVAPPVVAVPVLAPLAMVAPTFAPVAVVAAAILAPVTAVLTPVAPVLAAVTPVFAAITPAVLAVVAVTPMLAPTVLAIIPPVAPAILPVVAPVLVAPCVGTGGGPRGGRSPTVRPFATGAMILAARADGEGRPSLRSFLTLFAALAAPFLPLFAALGASFRTGGTLRTPFLPLGPPFRAVAPVLGRRFGHRSKNRQDKGGDGGGHQQ